MVSKRELEKLTVEELEELSYDLDKQSTKIREDKVRVQEVLGEKNRIVEAERRVAAMDDDQRAALAQVLKTAPVESEEDAGTPDAS